MVINPYNNRGDYKMKKEHLKVGEVFKDGDGDYCVINAVDEAEGIYYFRYTEYREFINDIRKGDYTNSRSDSYRIDSVHNGDGFVYLPEYSKPIKVTNWRKEFEVKE